MALGEMNLRLELFVEDVERSVAFYQSVLGFSLVRKDPGYASIRRGNVTLGIGPIGKLSETDGYFTRGRLRGERGLGVEIVLEAADFEEILDRVTRAGYPINDSPTLRPWGLTDFRLIDPDGYYLRITTI